MVKNSTVIAGAAALGLLYAGTRRENGGQNGSDGNGGEDTLSCQEQTAAAQNYAQSVGACDGVDVVLACPHGDVTYSPQTDCEENFLRARGWTEADTGQPTEPDQPEFRQYTVQILSDSPTALQYKLHVGPNPTAVTSGVDPKYRAEPGDGGNDTVTAQPDGTYLIEGRTGSSDGSTYGDSWRWTTADSQMYGILGWDANLGSDAYTVRVDGTNVDPLDLPQLTV